MQTNEVLMTDGYENFDPYDYPDWPTIRSMTRAGVRDLTYWSLGLDQRSKEGWPPEDHPHHQALCDELCRRMHLIENACFEGGPLPPAGGEGMVRLADFITWAVAQCWDLPDDLKRSVAMPVKMEPNQTKAPRRGTGTMHPNEAESMAIRLYVTKKYFDAQRVAGRKIAVEPWVRDNLDGINDWAERQGILLRYKDTRTLSDHIRRATKAAKSSRSV